MRREEITRPEGGPLMNEAIKFPTVRLLDQNQKMVGTCSRMEALSKAREAGLDLVMVSEDADPPVVRIVDFKKYMFDQQKRKKEQQKKASANRSEVKELKMRYNIDTHDYEVKMRASRGFLADGHRVKLVVNFKGRETEFRDMGFRLLEKFNKDVGEVSTGDARPMQEGRNLIMLISPNRVAVQKIKAAKAKPDSSSESADEASRLGDSEGESDADSEEDTSTLAVEKTDNLVETT